LANRLQTGERVDVEAYVRAHPEQAERLRRLLPAVLALAQLGDDGEKTSEPSPKPDAAPMTGCLGDFRLLREIGRGGMGVVYEAEQVSLGRRVAVKVLPFAAALDSKRLQRFKNEAQAAAQLHHGNIVPVHFVGCERGVHFFAMQFIDGRTLAEVIEELRQHASPTRESADRASEPIPEGADTTPRAGLSTERSINRRSYFRSVAQLGVQAAEALEQAHQHGVIHRDVKPANLLVDARGKVWITDFGLAQFQSDTRLTLSGDLVGTLRYVSPEQALGQPLSVDHRTDLYSLGATLYELLTLEPALDGRDRQELLRQIAEEEVKPPRRINRAIPAELETIVLKAMAKNPAERYATAQELANDLERFLKDEPIRAKRPTLLQRSRKWARRHQPVLWSAAASLLVALTVLAGSVGWIVRDRAARRAKIVSDLETALEDAQRFRGEGKWPQAQAAAKRAENLVGDDVEDPALAERVRDLLRELANDEAERRLLARLEELRSLQSNVKNDQFVLGSTLPSYQRAFHEYGLRPETVTPKQAATRLRDRPRTVRGVFLAALDHWLILARFKKSSEERWLEQVLDEADADAWRKALRVARGRNDRAALEKLARDLDVTTQPPDTLFQLEMSLQQRGAREAAVALLLRAQETFPNDFWINHDLGLILQQCQPPRLEESIRYLTVAVALRPDSPGARLNLGHSLWYHGRLEEASASYRKAIDLKPDYVMAHRNLGHLLAEMGRVDEAVEVCRRLTVFKPKDANAFYELANFYRKNDQLDEAVAAFRRAIELEPDYAEAHCDLGLTLRDQGKFTQALAALKHGNELGQRRPNWSNPSAVWLRECQRLVELDRRLPAVLRGDVKPANSVEWNEYAQLCQCKKLYVASARLRVSAFREDPSLAGDLKAAHRYDAACAAALAAAGRGADADPRDHEGRARWRKQALQWLGDDLTAYSELLRADKGKDRQFVRKWLRHWQRDLDLASLRDISALAQLSAGEREACEQLWARVEAMLHQAGDAK
jgi:serine/threonine protein kinase/Flp pilus assembly protein TadD